MNVDLRSLIFGIAGLLSTVVVSGLGLYFTARARVAPMRELLYSKQLDLAQRLFRSFGRASVFAVLISADNEYRDQAREDMGVVVKCLSILTDEAGALLPTELYVVVKHATDALSSFVQNCDEGRNPNNALDQFRGQEVKAVLMVRALLGVDQLSNESIRLFSERDDLSGLAETSPEEILARARGTED